MSATIKLVGRENLHRFIADSLLIDMLRVKAGNALTPFYSAKVFHDVTQIMKKHQYRPDSIMEIGTGCSLTTLACFLADGASRAVGVDIQPMDPKSELFYREAARYLAVASGLGWWRNVADTNKNTHVHYHAWQSDLFVAVVNRVEYYAPVTADHLPFPDQSFDFMYSIAVLEHVAQPAATIAEIKRLLKPGALTFHEIDLRDHDSTDPLEFLRYSEDAWQALGSKYGNGKGIERLKDGTWHERVYCNRLMASDWLRLFENDGFQIVEFEPICTIDIAAIHKENFAEPFRSRSFDDLATVAFRITLRVAG